MVLYNAKYTQSVIASDHGNQAVVSIADTWLKRLLGFKSKVASGGVDGVLIHPCSSIHTFGMQFDIDVYFLSEELRVIRSYPLLRSGRCRFVRGAKYVLELKSGKMPFPFASAGDYLTLAQYNRC